MKVYCINQTNLKKTCITNVANAKNEIRVWITWTVQINEGKNWLKHTANLGTMHKTKHKLNMWNKTHSQNKSDTSYEGMDQTTKYTNTVK